MSKFSRYVPPDIAHYVLEHGTREPDILRQLREETAPMAGSQSQISPQQGQFMRLLAKLMGARHCLELGVFTGYSSLAVALALPEDGELIACDINPASTAIARRFWDQAGVGAKVHERIGPALDSLEDLLAEGRANSFDFMFIDADKLNIATYYEYGLELVHAGGLIAVDNTLWGGKVADAATQDQTALTMRVFNAELQTDERVEMSMLPVGDGLTLALKR